MTSTPPSMSHSSSSTPTNNICDRCQGVPWDLIADPKQTSTDPYLWVSESHGQLKSSSCRICRLLANIKSPSLDGKICPLLSQRTCWIQCRSKWILDISQSSNLVHFGDESRGTIEVSRPDQIINIGIQRIDPEHVSFKRLQDCVSYCRQNHSRVCIRPTFQPASGFRVINCTDPAQRIVPAPPECKYAALSYVWGNTTRSCSSGVYPQVIVDAINVTLSMGLQYLWVDRHCIDQNNAMDKHNQISQMGNIYANSEITIIASAGTDATYGLPGISRPRKQQSGEVINGISLLEGFPHPVHAVKESAWARRGWTYQEAFLSPRRLVFTDYGVWYLCDKICLAEHEKVPITKISSLPTFEIRTFTPHPDLDDRYVAPRTRAANDMIVEYSRRELRYASDALDAMLGVLQFLETKGVYSIWGTVIYEERPVINWQHKHPGKRRPGFPSWSPLGWEGPIKLENFLGYNDFEVALGEKSETPLPGQNPISTTAAGLAKGGKDAPRFLHLTGYVVDLLLENIQWADSRKSHQTTFHLAAGEYKHNHTLSDGTYASLRISPETSVLAKAKLDGAEGPGASTRTRPVLGLLLRRYSDDAYYPHLMDPTVKNADFLLLERRQGGGGSGAWCWYYERIGYLECKIRAQEEEQQQEREKDYLQDTVFVDGVSGDVLDDVSIPRGDPLWREGAGWRTVVVG
ncbi:HET-domain-containing protein [Daldinia caldariorum]|uniref:HET-domain-containing protein n=1 Tax=Daldinia caldariorum TaxID=326644 RepID=UPI0020076975|nr:HET-domain-containing protein [Daldinia caldariorum]KAI1466182.1 HET-domain-containing protein [Daldinia caldariorum]